MLVNILRCSAAITMAACSGLRHQGRQVPHYIMQSGSVIALLQPPPPRAVPLKIAVPPKNKSSKENLFCYDETAAVSSVSACLKVCVCVWQVPPPSLGHDMAQLLESGQAADVRFKVEEEELAAHKFILTARSPVFRSVAAALFILL